MGRDGVRGHERWAGIIAGLEDSITFVAHRPTQRLTHHDMGTTQAQHEDEELDAWLRTIARPVHAPCSPTVESADFTARVMQRVSTQPKIMPASPPRSWPAEVLTSARAIGGVILIALLLVLLPSFLTALLMPGVALNVLTILVHGLLALLTVLSLLIQLASAFLSNDLAMLAMTALVATCAVICTRLVGPAVHLTREA